MESSSSEQSKKYSKRYSSEELEKPIIALLDDNPHGLNINQIAQQLDINRNTISKWLKTLEAKNIIVSRKLGVSNLYYKVEKTNEIFPGPYIITVEAEKDTFKIKKSNNNYLNRIREIKESLIGNNLFKYYPFNESEDLFKNFFENAINSLRTDEFIKKKISLKNSDDKNESFIFKVTQFPDKKDNFIIEFEDLTLLKFQEEQLLNTDSVSTLLNLFTDSYISIQNQDHKVIMANKRTLDDFNKGLELTSEPIFCYDLYRDESIECIDCIGKKAIETGSRQKTEYEIGGKNREFEAIPIESAETKMKGYILISRDN